MSGGGVEKPSLFARLQKSISTKLPSSSSTATPATAAAATPPSLSAAHTQRLSQQAAQQQQPTAPHPDHPAPPIDTALALQWQQRAVAAALHELSAAQAALACTTRVRQLLELAHAASTTAVALMLAEERDGALRLAVDRVESSSAAAASIDPVVADPPLLSVSLMRALAERVVEAGNAHAAALGALSSTAQHLDQSTEQHRRENDDDDDHDDEDREDDEVDDVTIQAATASAGKLAVADPALVLSAALGRATLLTEQLDEHGNAFGEFAADGSESDDSDADSYADGDGGMFVDEAEHVGSANPDEAWPCYEIAVVDGVWRERDLRAIAALHRPPTRAETMHLLAGWLDNAAHPHGRALSLFLAALLHCVSSHRAGATQARVRLADASRLLPGGTGGAHRCRVCGNQYAVVSDLDTHMRRRHARTVEQANAAALARNDREDARALLDEAVVATKAFIASTHASLHRQYPSLPARALRAALEHLVLERVYPHLAALYAHADEHASMQLDDRIDVLSELHPAVFDVGAVFWPLLGVREAPCRDGRLSRVDLESARRARSQGLSDPPPGVAADNMIVERAGPPLNALAAYTSVSGKLRALAAVGGIIARCIERHFGAQQGRVVLGADDLLPLMLYVIVRARPRSLLSQLHAMEAFITRDAVNGKYGYFLVTATMAVDYVSTLDVASLKADFQKRAAASGLQFSDDDGKPTPAPAAPATLDVPATPAVASAAAPSSPSKLGVPSLLSNLGSLSPRLRAASGASGAVAPAALLALPVAPDGETSVVHVNATRAQVAEFFATFGVVGDEDVLVRHSCLCKESSSLRRGVLVVTTRRLAFYRKSVQIVAEWSRVRSVARRRGSGAAFGASIEVSVRVAPDSDINLVYTYAAFQCTVESVIERIEAARLGAKMLLYREFPCKWLLPSASADKPVQLQPVVLRVDESDMTTFDAATKEMLEKHSLRRVRQWTQQPGSRVVVDVGGGDARVFVAPDATDDVAYWLQFVTNRVASRAPGALPMKVFMSDHHTKADAQPSSATAAAPGAAAATVESDSTRNKAAVSSRQLMQLAGSLDSRVSKHVAALRAEALLTSVSGLASSDAGAHAQTLLTLADRIDACKPDDIRASRAPSLVLTPDALAAPESPTAAASSEQRPRSRTRDWHALCSNYAANVRDCALQELAPLQALWALATAETDDARALYDALVPLRSSLVAVLETVASTETTLGVSDANDARIAAAVAAANKLT